MRRLLLLVWLLCARVVHASQQRDLYKVLGVPKTCTDKELKKAYRQACLKHHPDKGGDECVVDGTN